MTFVIGIALLLLVVFSSLAALLICFMMTMFEHVDDIWRDDEGSD